MAVSLFANELIQNHSAQWPRKLRRVAEALITLAKEDTVAIAVCI